MNLCMQTWQWQRSKENNGGMTVRCNFMNEILAFLLLLLFVSDLRAGILTSEGYLWRNTIENSRVLLNTSSTILRLCDSQRKHLSNAKRERESLLIFHIPRKNHWKNSEDIYISTERVSGDENDDWRRKKMYSTLSDFALNFEHFSVQCQRDNSFVLQSVQPHLAFNRVVVSNSIKSLNNKAEEEEKNSCRSISLSHIAWCFFYLLLLCAGVRCIQDISFLS